MKVASKISDKEWLRRIKDGTRFGIRFTPEQQLSHVELRDRMIVTLRKKGIPKHTNGWDGRIVKELKPKNGYVILSFGNGNHSAVILPICDARELEIIPEQTGRPQPPEAT